MEFNFALLIAMALLGLVAKMMVGWNPHETVGKLSFALLNLWVAARILPLAFGADQLAIEEKTNIVIERLVSELGSMIVGEVAGVYAAAIFQTARSWLRG